MNPKDLWDVDNLFDLVESNHNEFNNSIFYNEYENHINDFEEPLNEIF